MFRYCKTNNFRRKILILPPPPSYPYTFSLPETFWNTAQKGSPTKFFGTVRQKIFDENLDTPPSPLIHKLFRYRKFSETHRRMFQLRNFSAMWDKKIFDGKSWYSPLPPLIHTLFRYRKFSETHRRMFQLRNFSAMWDKKISTENLDTPPSPLIHKLLRCRKLSETQHRRVHLQNFSALWDKKFSTENLDTPPSPLLSIHFFATGNVLKHSTEGFLYEMFRYCKTKNFRRKILILPPPPSYPYTFSLPEIFWNTPPNVSTTKFFGNVGQKIFDRKSWYSPLPSYP